MKILVTDRKGEVHEVEATAGEPLMFALPLRIWSMQHAVVHAPAQPATSTLRRNGLGELAPASEDEEEVIEFLKFGSENSRLSCQLMAAEDLDGMRVTVAPEEGF